MTSPFSDRPAADFDEQRIGGRIRALRTERELSLRALAGRLDISASALSQIERGKMRPSVTRLYQIMSELDVPMAAIFGDGAPGRETGAEQLRVPERAETPGPGSVRRAEDGPGGWPGPLPVEGFDRVSVTRADEAATIVLNHGVRYRRLSPEEIPGMNYFESTYPPGAFSSQNAEYVRHGGREIGLVVSGELVVDLGFDSHRLGPGDSISYPSTTPHRISNQSAVPAVAVWLNLP